MNTEPRDIRLPRLGPFLAAFAVFAAGPAWSQVPVDESGEPVGEPVEAVDDRATGDVTDETPIYTDEELEALVGPIALYPDDLLAVVLPASTYPLEIVQAARFLEELESDSSLEPDESWDDSVVALLNYPEVVEMMNEDLDWTWQLGEAVVAQQPDVIDAIERFRDRAYAAGNLESDGYQKVERNDEGAIEIDTVEDEIIYVPYYEPERVVVHQPRPVYFYYPQAYPVYYYPYPAHYRFGSRYFWGVTTAFRIGWTSHHLHVFHHTYWGHPYYGRHYFGHWYRQPSISIYNSYYVNHHLRRARHHHRDGDFWRPRRVGGARPGHYRERIARYREPRLERTREGHRDGSRSSGARPVARDSDLARRLDGRSGFRGEARSRGSADTATQRRGFAASRERAERRAASGDDDRTIRFRPRERSAGDSGRITNRGSANGRAAENRRARSSRDAPRDRSTAVRDRSRSSDVSRRSAEPPARVSRPPASRSAPRARSPQQAATPRRAAPRSSSSGARRSSTPRRASPPRASAPRASSPQRSATPRRAAPRSSSSGGTRSSTSRRAAPARESRAAPSRRSSGTRSRNGSRVREH